jgi:hypothetical protein
MTAGVGTRIAGLADDVLRGEAPIAVGRMVERIHPNVERLLPDAIEPATSFALHLDGGIEPARNAREAGAIIVRRGREPGPALPLGRRGDTLGPFPMHAALQGDDGQWFVARLRATIEGAEMVNQRLAFHGINNGDPVLTRTAPQLRLVSLQEAGFPFRVGADEVAMRRPNFSPEGFLGDRYQPAVVDAHLNDARAAMQQLRTDLDAIHPRRWFGIGPSRVEGADLHVAGGSRARVHNSLSNAHQELLPDEQGLVHVDPQLRAQVRQLAAAVEDARLATTDVPHWQLRETVDVPLLRERVARVGNLVDALGDAPQLASGGESLAATQLTEFHALVERLQSGSFLAREAAARVFPYEKFGRTAAERMRNVGVAMEALDARVGFGDRGVYRLKSWLRDLAVDAGAVRRDLRPGQRDLDTLLAQVEEYAARNGAEGPVKNARGVYGYEDFPDYAEVGAMGGALRTYIAVDDAGRLAAESAPAPPAASELLRW